MCGGGHTSTTTFDHCISNRGNSGFVQKSWEFDGLVTFPKPADGYVVKGIGPTSTTTFTIDFPNAGEIPETLGNLPNLVELYLNDNKLTGAR